MSTDQQKTLNIYERIQAVANDIVSIEKDITIGSGSYGYKAVSDLAVIKKVKELESRHRIVSIPMKQSIEHQELVKTTGKGSDKVNYSVYIKLTTKVVNLDNPSEYEEIESYGHGLDTGDKSFGKAATYARKYALLNLYKIGTGEDPDSKASEQEAMPTATSDKLKAVANYLHTDNTKLIAVLQQYSVENLDMLSDKEVEIIYSGLRKRNLI